MASMDRSRTDMDAAALATPPSSPRQSDFFSASQPSLSPPPPWTPAQVLKYFNSSLTAYEQGEILEFKRAWFLGTGGHNTPQLSVTDKAAASASTRAPNNHSFDDGRGEYVRVIPGDHIAYRYEIVEVLGAGSFGQVIKCFDHNAKEMIAVKMVRNKKRFKSQAQIELALLQRVRDVEIDQRRKLADAGSRGTATTMSGATVAHTSSPMESSKSSVSVHAEAHKITAAEAQELIDHHIIHVKDSFTFRNHMCFTFPLLSINLYELVKKNNFKGLSLNLVRRFGAQIAQGLAFMHTLNIVHADLKPENVLLRASNKSGVAIIDLGSSCYENERIYTYIQSRFYRAPEVILQLAYGRPIDIWSFGCILAELISGYPLFGGEDESEQLACMMEVLGLPPHGMVQSSPRRTKFFDESFSPVNITNSRGRRREPSTKSMTTALRLQPTSASDPAVQQFINLLQMCLKWDPAARATPFDVLRHPFIASAVPTHVLNALTGPFNFPDPATPWVKSTDGGSSPRPVMHLPLESVAKPDGGRAPAAGTGTVRTARAGGTAGSRDSGKGDGGKAVAESGGTGTTVSPRYNVGQLHAPAAHHGVPFSPVRPVGRPPQHETAPSAIATGPTAPLRNVRDRRYRGGGGGGIAMSERQPAAQPIATVREVVYSGPAPDPSLTMGISRPQQQQRGRTLFREGGDTSNRGRTHAPAAADRTQGATRNVSLPPNPAAMENSFNLSPRVNRFEAVPEGPMERASDTYRPSPRVREGSLERSNYGDGGGIGTLATVRHEARTYALKASPMSEADSAYDASVYMSPLKHGGRNMVRVPSMSMSKPAIGSIVMSPVHPHHLVHPPSSSHMQTSHAATHREPYGGEMTTYQAAAPPISHREYVSPRVRNAKENGALTMKDDGALHMKDDGALHMKDDGALRAPEAAYKSYKEAAEPQAAEGGKALKQTSSWTARLGFLKMVA